MEQILKAATVAKQLVDENELALINNQTLRELGADEVFTFRLAACNNQVDRDYERFTEATIEGLANKFVGKSVLMDHAWSAKCQTARVYGTHVETVGEIKRLILRCYMPRTEDSAKTITAIETGILRECSVGCLVNRVVCNICGADQTKTCCAHIQGKEYDGKICVMELDGAKDAYEVSLVAVPAQPEAGVVKTKRYGGKEVKEPKPPPPPKIEPPSIMEQLSKMMRKDDKT